MKKTLSIFAVLVLTTAAFSIAQGMGGGMGEGNDWDSGGSGGGSGWDSGGGMGGGDWDGADMGTGVAIADDGSLLLRSLSAAMDGTVVATLRNVDRNGVERWRVDFSGKIPSELVTAGDLVILGSHDRRVDMTQGDAISNSGLIALDLQNGQELWTTAFDGKMISSLEFAPDGSQIYVTVWDGVKGAQLIAFDLSGIELWRLELAA